MTNNLNNHFDLSDLEFEEQFAKAILKAELFTHEAHLRLAWIHLKKYGQSQAIENICRQIQRYVKKLGAEDKYNTALTIAAIKAVNHFMLRSDTNSFHEFINLFPQLKYQFKELIASHYKADIYYSKRAKKAFIEPDLAPFN